MDIWWVFSPIFFCRDILYSLSGNTPHQHLVVLYSQSSFEKCTGIYWQLKYVPPHAMAKEHIKIRQYVHFGSPWPPSANDTLLKVSGSCATNLRAGLNGLASSSTALYLPFTSP